MAQEVRGREAAVMLFNGPVETGLRALVLLDTAFPTSYDLIRLTWFDHLIVHTGEFGGPPSLHPDLPQSTGELLVRRALVAQGLQLLRRMHMVELTADSRGLEYRATDAASAMVNSMATPYALALRERAIWVVDMARRLSAEELKSMFSSRLGKWAIEFQGEPAKEAS
jgi:hypothetical protein